MEQSYKKETKNLNQSLKKLPKKYRDLVKGFEFRFLDGSALENDPEHIGYKIDSPKVIAVAGPWHYGREFTLFHEIGHLVWERLLDDVHKKDWKRIVDSTEGKRQHQGIEEMFCMSFANYYVKNKMVIHDHPEWQEFMKKLNSSIK